jgi:mycothiol synthase
MAKADGGANDMIEVPTGQGPAVNGLRFRPYRGEDDLPAMLKVYSAAHEADGLEEITTLDQMKLNYATLVNCDPARDIVMAEVGGDLVAYARVFWMDLVDGGRTYECFGFVHPAWRRRGIGAALLRHNEARLREIAAQHVDVGPKWLSSEGIDADTGNTALLTGAGYEPARYFYDMVVPSLDGIVAPPMPEGIELRPVTREQYRVIWEASAEAFRDHWGEAEWVEADWERFVADPDNADPRLWRVGWDGDEVAGVVATTVPVEENELHGRARVYVAMVSVRRPWRRRGLARALLVSSLVGARNEGFTSASLGVDTNSPTGATALYESLGFAPEKSFTAWRKPL